MIGIEIDDIRQLYDVPNKDLIFIVKNHIQKIEFINQFVQP